MDRRVTGTGRGRWASNSYFSRMRANNLNFEIINSGYNDSPHMCDSALIRDSARTPSSSLCLNSRVIKQTRNGANIGIYGNRYMCEHTRELYLGWRERDREAAAGAAARRPQGAGAGARRAEAATRGMSPGAGSGHVPRVDVRVALRAVGPERFTAATNGVGENASC